MSRKTQDPFNPSKNFNPSDPLQHLSTSALITDWLALKTAIENGAIAYLDKRNTKEISGLSHGNDGRHRAENLRDLNRVNANDNADKTKLFAMLYAVFAPNPGWFESRSSALAMCIANQLIQGDFSHFSTSIDPDEKPEIKNTLESNVFSKNALTASTSDYTASLSVFATETVTNIQYNKTGAVRSFLQHARDNMPESEIKSFDAQVALFKRELIKKPAETEEMQSRIGTPQHQA